MSAARVPVVLGLGPGVGAATVATALLAHASSATDVGPLYGMAGGLAADIAVCSGSEVSLQRAESLRGAPVVVIVLVDDRPPPSRARQRQLGLRHRAVVVLPHVAHWAGLSAVPDEAALLLAQGPEHLPRTLRDYAGALRLVVTALMRGGSLREPQPPRLTWSPPPPTPRTTALPAPRQSTPPPPAPAQAAPARPAPPAATPAPAQATSGRPAPPAATLARRTPPQTTPRPATPQMTPARGSALSPAELALDDDALEAQALASTVAHQVQASAPRRDDRQGWDMSASYGARVPTSAITTSEAAGPSPGPRSGMAR